MVALGFDEYNFAAGGHNDEIREMVAGTVQAETLACIVALMVAVPPLDVGQSGQFQNHIGFGTVHVIFFSSVQALSKAVGTL